MSIPVHELIGRWREEAETIRRRYGAEGLALLCDTHALELETALHAPLDTKLTVDEAARRSGYSRSHLRRLLDTGVLPNAGRRRAPRVRLGDLPSKPGHRQQESHAQPGGAAPGAPRLPWQALRAPAR